MILPYITYGIAVWGQAAQTNLDTLFILQKRALRLIHFAPCRSHAIPLFNQYNIPSLDFQYYKSVCTIMHDVFNNSLPANISNLFLYPTQLHRYNTSLSDTASFNIEYARTNELKHSFLDLVQEFGTVFLEVSEYSLNINLRRIPFKVRTIYAKIIY